VSGGYFSSTALGVAFNNTLSGTIDLALSNSGTYGIVYAASVVGCGMVTTTTSVTINSIPGLSFNYLSNPYCTGAGFANPAITTFTGGYFSKTVSGIALNTMTGAVDLGASSAGTYIIQYNLSVPGCGFIQTVTGITLNSLPGLSLSYAGSPYCQGLGTRSATYNTVPGGYFSAGTGLSISTLSGIIDLSTSNSGTYTVSYSVSVSGCGMTSTTGMVTINTTPGLVLNYPGTPYCINAGTAPASYPTIAGGYFSTVAGLSLSTTTGTINLNASKPGTYTVIYNVLIAGCGLTQTSTGVTLNSLPGLSLSYVGSPYCQNSSITGIPTYNAVAGGAFGTVAGLSLNTSTGVIDLTGSAGGTYTITYSTAVAGCGTTSTTTSITINTVPGLSVSYPAGPNCQGGSTIGATYSPVTGAYFTANPIGLTVNSITGDLTLSSSTGGSYTVSYNVSVAGCNVVSQSTTVSVTGLALAGTITNPNPVCSMTGVTLTNVGSSGMLQWQESLDNITWSDLSGAITSTYSTTANGAKYYRVTAHQGTCPLVTGSGVQLSPVESPWIKTFSYPVISGQSQYCKPQSSTTVGLNILSSGGGQYSVQPSGLNVDVNGMLTINSSTPAATYMITYSISGGGICSNVSTTTSVLIEAPLTSGVSFNYSQNPVCSNTSVTLISPGVSGGFYTLVTPLPGVTLSPANGGIVYNSNLTGRQQIGVKYTVNNACKDNYIQTLTVVGQPTKPATPDYGGVTELCKANGKGQLRTYATSGVFLSNGKPGLSINSVTGFINAGSELKTYGIVYRLNDDGICGSLSSDSAYVLIKSSKAGMLSSDKPQTEGVCEGDSIHITLTGNEGTIGWIYNTQTLTGVSGSTLDIQSSIGDQNITAISKKDNCPSETTSYMIVSAQKSKGGIAIAKETEICNIPSNTQIELTESIGTIQWQMSDDSLKNYTVIDHASSTTAELTIPELNQYGIKKYYKAVVKSGACPSEISSIAIVKTCKPDNFVPNALTPNSGDQNSSWNLKSLKLASTAEIRVFNRYGTEVYYATGNKVIHDKWDGGGLAAGTYYYVIKRNEPNVNIEPKVLSGAVTIIK
jgi:gliding motility-associated-like protein